MVVHFEVSVFPEKHHAIASRRGMEYMSQSIYIIQDLK